MTAIEALIGLIVLTPTTVNALGVKTLVLALPLLRYNWRHEQKGPVYVAFVDVSVFYDVVSAVKNSVILIHCTRQCGETMKPTQSFLRHCIDGGFIRFPTQRLNTLFSYIHVPTLINA